MDCAISAQPGDAAIKPILGASREFVRALTALSLLLVAVPTSARAHSFLLKPVADQRSGGRPHCRRGGPKGSSGDDCPGPCIPWGSWFVNRTGPHGVAPWTAGAERSTSRAGTPTNARVTGARSTAGPTPFSTRPPPLCPRYPMEITSSGGHGTVALAGAELAGTTLATTGAAPIFE
eukprot:IDg23529t1